jgi:hypothetical protein
MQQKVFTFSSVSFKQIPEKDIAKSHTWFHGTSEAAHVLRIFLSRSETHTLLTRHASVHNLTGVTFVVDYCDRAAARRVITLSYRFLNHLTYSFITTGLRANRTTLEYPITGFSSVSLN